MSGLHQNNFPPPLVYIERALAVLVIRKVNGQENWRTMFSIMILLSFSIIIKIVCWSAIALLPCYQKSEKITAKYSTASDWQEWTTRIRLTIQYVLARNFSLAYSLQHGPDVKLPDDCYNGSSAVNRLQSRLRLHTLGRNRCSLWSHARRLVRKHRLTVRYYRLTTAYVIFTGCDKTIYRFNFYGLVLFGKVLAAGANFCWLQYYSSGVSTVSRW